MSRQPFKDETETRTDAEAMREAAREYLGWAELSTDRAAEMVTLSDGRAWRRFEESEERRAKTMPAPIITAFWHTVVLTKLEELEEQASGDDALWMAELGADVKSPIKTIFDLCDAKAREWGGGTRPQI